MNKIDPQTRFAPGEGETWSYGMALEQPLESSAAVQQVVQDPREDADRSAGSTGAAAKGPRPAGAPDEADRGRQDGGGARTDDKPAEQDGTDGKGAADEPPPPPGKLVFVVAGLVLLALLGWGAYTHWRRDGDAAATQQTTRDAVPEVRVTEAKRDGSPIALTLPGQTEAFETANIFPRATGYITRRHVDIGSRVRQGDLLLHISSPELDQQLEQAVAQLGQVQAAQAQAAAQVTQAEANLNLAKVTLARTATLTQQGYETQQNRDNQVANQASQAAALDTARAGVRVAEANTKAQQATIDRLKALTGFEDVAAPFDGIITVRNVDNGDLVNADTASATPMFSIARDDVIRVTVQVPQNASAGVREGVPATVDMPSSPGQKATGTVTRSSVALLSSARTLDTEVDIANPDGGIRPGLFVYVTMQIPREHAEVAVPAEALIFNQDGLQVAVVEGDTARLRTVRIDRDLGTSVTLGEGLSGGEQVVLSPPSLLRDGMKVKAAKADDKAPGGGGQPGGGAGASGDKGGGAGKG